MATVFVVKGELGQGEFGVVYLIEKKDTKEKLALKAVDLCRSQPSERKKTENEAELLRRLDNPYVVSYVTSYVLEDWLCIITEFCEGGDLNSYLDKNAPLPEDLIIYWTAQITMALEYLHKENVLHRDLKPRNIFLTGDGNIRVGDMGIARVLEQPDAMANTYVGTRPYMSPERLLGKPYDSKADIWSLGCVVFEMMAGLHTLKKHIPGKVVPSASSRYSEPLRDLVAKTMATEPQERPDASSLLNTSPIKDHLSTVKSVPSVPSRYSGAVPDLVEKTMATEPQERPDASSLLNTSPIKGHLSTVKSPTGTVKETRTASFRNKDVKIPLDALEIHRQRMQQLEGSITTRGDTVPRRVDAAAPKGSNALNVLLVGKTGVGKSSTGNSILGREAFKAGAGFSVTKACEGADGERFSENIFVVDTPGACDTEELDTLKIIDNYVTENQCELHVICLTLSASGRPTKEEMSAVKGLCSLFGPAMLAHLIVVVTREEDLRREGKTARDFLLAYTGAGAELLKDCVEDDRVVGLDNFKEDTRENQVQTFFQKTKEIIAKNKGALYTPAMFMQRKAELEKEQEEFRRMQQKLKKEKEEFERQKRVAEIEEAGRKIRQEEQEKAHLEKMKEIKALQGRHEEERRIQEEEADRRRKEFEEQQRKHANEIEDERKRQQKKWAEQQAEIKHRETELMKYAGNLQRNEEKIKSEKEKLELERKKHEEFKEAERHKDREKVKHLEQELEKVRRKQEAEEAERKRREDEKQCKEHEMQQALEKMMNTLEDARRQELERKKNDEQMMAERQKEQERARSLQQKSKELEKKREEAEEAARKRQEEDARRRSEDERLRALQDQIQKEKEAMQEKEERIRRQGKEMQRKEEEWERQRRQEEENSHRINPVTREGGGELRIVLVGKSGCGTSATCNMIAGKIKKSERLFKTSALGKSETEKCQMEKIERFGRLVTLVDTPGLCDTNRKREDVEKSIGGFAALSVPGPHAIVLVLSAAGRGTPEEVQYVRRLIALFGKKIMDYLIILITNTESWEEWEITPQSFLHDLSREMKDVIPAIVRQHRAIAFQNTLRGSKADDQVRRLFGMIDDMVTANDQSFYRNEYWKQAEK